jgi:hypothetical protein
MLREFHGMKQHVQVLVEPAGYTNQPLSLFSILLASVVLMLLLSGCTIAPQTNSEIEHTSIALSANDLEDFGIGFLTPAAATTLETDKQSLSLMFADELMQMRPDVRVATLPAVLSAVNENGMAEGYKQMYRDYLETGILEQDLLREIGDVANVRYLAQLSLAGFKQGGTRRFGVFGLRMVETKQATMRVFMQIWDSDTGIVAWEATQEVNYAYDTGAEKPVTFKTIAELTAREMFQVLPGAGEADLVADAQN